MSNDTPSPDSAAVPSRPTWPLLALALLSVLALIDAALLTHTHALLLSQPDYESFCNISATVSCDDVLVSSYSKLMGVPVALFAVVAYGLSLAYSLLDLRALRNGNAGASNRLFALSVFNVLVSLVMASISKFVLNVWCPLCLGLYAISLVSLFLAWRNLPQGLGGFASGLGDELGGLFSRPPRSLLAEGGAALAIILLLLLFNLANPMGRKVSATGATPVKEPKKTAPADIQRMTQLEQMRRWYESNPDRQADPGGATPQGAPNAPIQIVEFADLQCPACKRGWEVLHRLLKKYPDKIELHYRHFPLSNDCNPGIARKLHAAACTAAKGAICADQQGDLWDFVDHVFTYQPRLTDENVFTWAEELGLDMKKFRACVADPATDARLKEDVDAGLAAQISSTPTVIINGKYVKSFLGMSDEVLDLFVEVLSEQ